MRCRECGRTWPEGVLFCRECGSPLEPDDVIPEATGGGGRICPQCGTPIPVGDDYCVVCGSPAPASPAAPRGKGAAMAAVAAVAVAVLGLIVVLVVRPTAPPPSSTSVGETASSADETPADALVSVSEVLSDSYPKILMYVSVRDATGRSVSGLGVSSWSIVEVGEKGGEATATIDGCEPVIEGGSTYKVGYTSTADKAAGSVLTAQVTVDTPEGLTGSDESSYSRPKEESKADGGGSSPGGADKADGTPGSTVSSVTGTGTASTTSTTTGTQKEPEKSDSTGGGTSTQPPVTPPAQEPTGPTRVEVVSGEFVLPDSFRRYYSVSELYGLSDWELRVARNEIYARFGRGFNDAGLQSHFDSCSWYTRRYSPEEFDSLPLQLNDFELANIETIRAVETERAEAASSPTPGGGEFILPDSSYRFYSVEELSGLSSWELRLARNEIFARHGRGFNDPDLQSHFDSCSWYTRRYSPEDFDSMPSPLNDCEAANVQTIRAIETSR